MGPCSEKTHVHILPGSSRDLHSTLPARGTWLPAVLGTAGVQTPAALGKPVVLWIHPHEAGQEGWCLRNSLPKMPNLLSLVDITRQ